MQFPHSRNASLGKDIQISTCNFYIYLFSILTSPFHPKGPQGNPWQLCIDYVNIQSSREDSKSTEISNCWLWKLHFNISFWMTIPASLSVLVSDMEVWGSFCLQQVKSIKSLPLLQNALFCSAQSKKCFHR